MTVAAPDSRSDMVSHDLGADYSHRLALSGVDLAGHDRGAGLILRQYLAVLGGH